MFPFSWELLLELGIFLRSFWEFDLGAPPFEELVEAPYLSRSFQNLVDMHGDFFKLPTIWGRHKKK